MSFLNPEERSQVFSDTQQLLTDLGSGRVNAVVVTHKDCPQCAQVNGVPLNPMCPTCGGDGWIDERASVQIPASVKWGAQNKFGMEPVGKDDQGTCTVEVQPQWQPYFIEGSEIEVDGQRVIIDEICPTGIGQVSRIIVKCSKKVNAEDE